MGWVNLSAKCSFLIRTVVVVLICSIALHSSAVFGQNSIWTSSTTLSLQSDDLISTALPQTIANYGNIDCIEHKFITRPARIVPYVQTEQSKTECAVETKFGYVSSSGLVHRNGTTVAGQLKNSNGQNTPITPIPNSSDLIRLVSSPNGSIVNYYQKIASRLIVNINLDGSVNFILPDNPTWILKDKSLNTRYIRPQTISFSRNGEWMFADSEHVAGLLVELSTGKIVPFISPRTYHLGTNPSTHASVDNQGKFVIVTTAQGFVSITDIESCSPVPSTINAPVSCQTKSYASFFNQSINGFTSVRLPRFINDQLISTIIQRKNIAGVNEVYKYRVAPNGVSIESTNYLALGDSYASGEGAYDYFEETDTDENMCHLSRSSYPYLIGQELGFEKYNSVACSGAKIENISDYVQKPQIPDPNTLGNMLPGYRTQIDYVEQLNPSIITIGIGGNDVGFGNVLTKCIFIRFSNTCYENYEDRLELVRLINKQLGRLEKIFSQLHSKAPSAKIYVTGYPSIAQNDGDCAINVRLDSDEIKFSNQLINYINLTIKTASERAGVYYSDITEAFYGYRMCETDSANSAVNGVTFGNDGPTGYGPIGNEGFHPNRLGHILLALKLMDSTNNLSDQMPVADQSADLPDENSELDILAAPVSGRGKLKAISFEDDMTDDTLIAGKSSNISLDGEKHSLNPNQKYKIELHSNPIELGEVNTDEEGNLISSFNLPIDVEIGLHTVHVIGKNINDEDIDIQKTVFVGFSENDFDGDGSLNIFDSCPLEINLFVDKDNDNIDDSCDQMLDTNSPLIDQPEKPVNNEEDAVENTNSSISKQKSSDKSINYSYESNQAGSQEYNRQEIYIQGTAPQENEDVENNPWNYNNDNETSEKLGKNSAILGKQINKGNQSKKLSLVATFALLIVIILGVIWSRKHKLDKNV